MTTNTMINTQQLPDAKTTADFLLQGGAFAVMCVLIIVGLLFAWFGGKALFALLRDYLGASQKQLERQTELLGEIHDEQKVARDHQITNTAHVNAWGTPDWLHKRLDAVELRLEDLKKQIADLRLAIATAGAKQLIN